MSASDRQTLEHRLHQLPTAAMPGFSAPAHPVWRASTVLFSDMAACRAAGAAVGRGVRGASTYGTAGTPTTQALADAISAMEGDDPDEFRTALVPSGLAAVTLALMSCLKTGDHVVMTDSVYGPARELVQGFLAQWGVAVTFVPGRVDPETLARVWQDNTRVLYLESPGSYTFEIQDIAALSAVAHARGAKVILDNTWASPLLLRPFDLGVDLSVIALTKYWSGHADVLMGAVVCRAADWLSVWRTERQLGLCVGGDDAALVLRGMATLSARWRVHEASALTLAAWLQTQAPVARVLHPALPTDPDHALWRAQFMGSNGLFAFELQPHYSAASVDRMINALQRFGIGYSWGGYESLVMLADLRSARGVEPWRGGPLVRLHVGLEPVALLQDDLAQALRVLDEAEAAT